MIRPAARVAFVLAVLPLLMPAGCSRAPSQAETATNAQMVPDIPLPAGAVIDSERSLILSDRDRWTGRVVLRVPASAADTVGFFQAQMPGAGWQPVMSVTSEVSVLTYLRGERAATLQVEPRTMGGALATLTVAPRQGEATIGLGTPPRATPTGRGERR